MSESLSPEPSEAVKKFMEELEVLLQKHDVIMFPILKYEAGGIIPIIKVGSKKANTDSRLVN